MIVWKRKVCPYVHWKKEAAMITWPFTITFHALFIFAGFPLVLRFLYSGQNFPNYYQDYGKIDKTENIMEILVLLPFLQ